MVFFKSCPRCDGDRVLESDFYGRFITCLACGHVSYPEVATLSAEARKAAAQARLTRIGANVHDPWAGLTGLPAR